MYSNPIMLPLDIEGKIYSLQDERGNTIGTGTREVCEVLMYLISRSTLSASEKSCKQIPNRPNVRAAIAI
jgi:hypothetical protein